MKKPDIKAFGKKAINTSQDAFHIEVFFPSGNMQAEFYGELSCKKKHPDLIHYEDGHIQGTFHFVSASKADLFLACSYFSEIGEEYYCFYTGDLDKPEFVIWTPNTKHFNKRKKEVE